MANFAVVENSIVINVIVAENQQIADEVVSATNNDDIAVYLGEDDIYVTMGWTYENGQFIAPPAPEPSPPPTKEK
jgi:hypothetical protein